MTNVKWNAYYPLVVDLDSLDARLLALVQADARQSLRKLALASGVSTPTAAARLRRLEQNGIILGYHARTAGPQTGRQVALIDCPPHALPHLVAALEPLASVEGLVQLAGGPLLVTMSHPSPGQLRQIHDLVAEAKGNYKIHPVASTWARPIATNTVGAPCHFCAGEIHGEPVRHTLGGRPHLFCCQQCKAAFTARFQKASAPFPIVKGRVVK